MATVEEASLDPAEKSGAKAPVLAIEDLSIAFQGDGGWHEVVRNVSLTVGSRETVAIVGESGSGKSVTALSVMRLLPRDTSRTTGRIIIEGRDVRALSERQMRHVRGNQAAMIFQEPMTSLNPIYTAGFQICEALQCHRAMTNAEAKAEAIRLLDRVRIPAAASRFNEYPHRMSGGMRQRVMIAMALASRPKLLIADEPTTALDVTVQGQILDLIKQLQDEEGMSVLFITHDMGVVAEISDRTVVMFRGEVVEAGGTADVFLRHKHPYTRSLLASVPKLGAMKGQAWPLRFPIVDVASGQASTPTEVAGTVDTRKTLLQVQNLVSRFEVRAGLLHRRVGAVHAVENVSFDVHEGETLSLVGESGCGKSTTGRAIMRLTGVDGGRINVDGVDVMSLGGADLRRMRRSIQMIFQDPYASLNPRLPVGEAIMEPFLEHRLGSRAEARERAADLMRRVGLQSRHLSRYPHEFSGGQRQRVCIARALVLGPKVIIADESVSALDVSVKAQILNLLLDLQEQFKLAFLFISHDMAVVERVSHRVAVMHLGEIVEIGPRAAVFENPQHAYTRKLMSAVPVPDPARRTLRRNIAVEELKSPLRPRDYVAPQRRYAEVSPGHFVQS